MNFTLAITLKLLISALAAFLGVSWIYRRILKIAMIKDIVDHPDSRKSQRVPVPVLGGIAVFFGLLVGALTFVAMTGGYNTTLLPVLLGASIIIYVGALDDILGISPLVRMIIESVVILGIVFSTGMAIDSFHGLWGIYSFSWWIAVPLTVFAGVGIINAYNMVDGVNGLSSGLCIVGSLILGVLFWKRQEFTDSMLALCFASALVPFFFHNVFGEKTRMFIGDAGTMVMGVFVTWFVITVMATRKNPAVYMNDAKTVEMCTIACLLAIASVPVADTLRVMTGRILHRKSPFSPDRTHLHHAFSDAGASHSLTSLSEIMINVLIVGCWYLTYKLGGSQELQLYVVIGVSALLVWGAYFLLKRRIRRGNISKVRIPVGSRLFAKVKKWVDKGAEDLG